MQSSNSTTGILIHALCYYLKYLYLTRPDTPKSPIKALTQYLLSPMFAPNHTIRDLERVDLRLHCHRRIFIAALITAHKYNREPAPSNKAWAKLSSSLSSHELTLIEREFLNGIGFALYIPENVYSAFSQAITYWKVMDAL